MFGLEGVLQKRRIRFLKNLMKHLINDAPRNNHRDGLKSMSYSSVGFSYDNKPVCPSFFIQEFLFSCNLQICVKSLHSTPPWKRSEVEGDDTHNDGD